MRLFSHPPSLLPAAALVQALTDQANLARTVSLGPLTPRVHTPRDSLHHAPVGAPLVVRSTELCCSCRAGTAQALVILSVTGTPPGHPLMCAPPGRVTGSWHRRLPFPPPLPPTFLVCLSLCRGTGTGSWAPWHPPRPPWLHLAPAPVPPPAPPRKMLPGASPVCLKALTALCADQHQLVRRPAGKNNRKKRA